MTSRALPGGSSVVSVCAFTGGVTRSCRPVRTRVGAVSRPSAGVGSKPASVPSTVHSGSGPMNAGLDDDVLLGAGCVGGEGFGADAGRHDVADQLDRAALERGVELALVAGVRVGEVRPRARGHDRGGPRGVLVEQVGHGQPERGGDLHRDAQAGVGGGALDVGEGGPAHPALLGQLVERQTGRVAPLPQAAGEPLHRTSARVNLPAELLNDPARPVTIRRSRKHGRSPEVTGRQ